MNLYFPTILRIVIKPLAAMWMIRPADDRKFKVPKETELVIVILLCVAYFYFYVFFTLSSSTIFTIK